MRDNYVRYTFKIQRVTMNPEARFKLELSEAQLEIERLRERLSTNRPSAPKDLSLVSLVPKWSGAE